MITSMREPSCTHSGPSWLPLQPFSATQARFLTKTNLQSATMIQTSERQKTTACACVSTKNLNPTPVKSLLQWTALLSGLPEGEFSTKMMLRHQSGHGVGYAGGAILPVFDAIYNSDKFRFVLPRHEQGAGHMAEGYARATGKPGVVLVTSGPGATNGHADARRLDGWCSIDCLHGASSHDVYRYRCFPKRLMSLESPDHARNGTSW